MFPIWYTKYVSLLDFKNYGFNKGTMMRKRLLDPSGAPSITSGLTQSSFYPDICSNCFVSPFCLQCKPIQVAAFNLMYICL